MAYTTINDPSAHFQTALYNGSSSSVTVTNDGNSNLKPDWLWFKRRSGSGSDHNVFDTVRGLTERIFPNLGSASDTTDPNGITSLTDGFTTGTSYGNVNGNGETFVTWQWAAGGTAPTKTYKVVVVSDSGNKYRFRNSADNATYAASAVTLDLQEGGTYTFDVSDNTVDSHPFVIGTSANSNEYSTGVVYKLDGVTKTYSQYTSGFSAATTRQLIITVAASAPTLYYWCSVHSGMGGQINTNSTFGSTNFDGSILSVVSANTTSGFSIVLHTGTGSAGTIGHGLGGVPNWIVTKRRTQADDWAVYQTYVGNEYYLEWNSTNPRQAASSVWGDTTPTDLNFTVGGANGKNNASSSTYVSYCFKSIKGYSKIGQYTGNGSQDGTFVYTGFKPAWIMAKRWDASKNWYVADSKRSPVNVNKAFLVPNSSDAENTGGNATDSYFDILSNGFKMRQDFSHLNASGAAHMYMAFAEHPFVASNNVIALAR